MFKTAQKLLFSLVFFVLLSLILHPLSFAQTSERTDLHNYTQTVMIEVTSSLTCMLAGIDPINPSQKCLGINNGKIGPVESTGGAIGTMGSLIAMTFTPPFHTGDYVGYLAGNFGITKPAYAQAKDGFNQLSPLTNIWVAFRNMTYLLLVLIFLIIGFAIMLRVRIDPRTVMSIENQIPKIIVGLILVTFSFAIVGLLIDLMWVFIYLSINVFQSIPGFDLNNKLTQATLNIHGENALGAFNNFIGYRETVNGATEGVAEVVRRFLTTPSAPFPDLPFVTGLFRVSEAVSNFPGWLIGSFAGVLAFFIISIALLYALFRLWFQLIKAYVMILIVAVFSPFWILAGLLPGSRLTFENLLREIGSNLITFPATLVMFLLAIAFKDVFTGPNANQIFTPPFIGNPGGEGLKAIGALTSLGIILLTPDVNKMMRKALQAPDFDFSAIGRAIGIGTAYPVSVGRQIGSIIAGRHESVLTTRGGVTRYDPRGIPGGVIGYLLGRR